MFFDFLKKPSSSQGVLYIAFGDKYINEAIHSAKSLKKFNPKLKTAIFTDKNPKEKCFDIVKIINPQLVRCKPDYLPETPFDRTLYLDSDTRINHNITEMFEILDKFDMAFTHAIGRVIKEYADKVPEYRKIPYSFPCCNGGLILYKNSSEVKDFFDSWNNYFKKYFNKTKGWDQTSLRIALWNSSLKIHILPVEYNVRSKQVREKINIAMSEGRAYKDLLKPRIFHWHGLDNPDDKTEPQIY